MTIRSMTIRRGTRIDTVFAGCWSDSARYCYVTNKEKSLTMKLITLGMMLLFGFFFSLRAQAQCTNTNLNGELFYTFSGTIKSGASNVSYNELGKVTADGNGGLSGTTTTSTAGVLATLPVSGSYSIQPNCSGTATLTTSANAAQFTLQLVSGGGTTLAMVSSSASGEIADGRIYRAANATGIQCGNGTLAGTYGALVSGGTYVGTVRTAFEIDGQFIFDGNGGFTSTGVLTTGTSSGSPISGSGTYSISADCSGTMQFVGLSGTTNYLLARIQGGSVLILESDANTTINGTANAQQFQDILPQFVFGGGWYSALYFTNGTSNTVSFPVSFTTDAGTPMNVPGVGTSKQVTIAPLGTALIEALNVGSLVQGYASVTVPAGVTGNGVFRQSVSGKPDQEALVGLKNANATAVTLTFDDTGTLTTSVAVVNPSTSTINVTITARDVSGNVLGTSTQALPPGNKIEGAMRGFLGLFGIAGQRGSALFSVPTGNIAVIGFRSESIAFTSIPTTEQQ
jgi:hypothetical protein